MHLINIESLEIVEYLDTQAPRYTILSHTWGEEEISLPEFVGQDATWKKGWAKVRAFSDVVAEREENQPDPIEHIWVDTCCIDKSSSAELSEAVNSMFRWYREASQCYAYLSDVEYTTDEWILQRRIGNSRWLKRGWTLQELLAPRSVSFFDKTWRFLGTREELASTISLATTIPISVVRTGNFDRASVAQKFSWAALRITTRPEDVAYCLLGMFGVNMPLLYGEGRKAFMRLQEEILKETDDQSIFAWDASPYAGQAVVIGALSPSPRYFADCGNIYLPPCQEGGSVSITNKSISVDLPCCHEYTLDSRNDGGAPRRSAHVRARLSCCVHDDIDSSLEISLVKQYPQGMLSRKPCKAAHVLYARHPEIERLTLVKESKITPPRSLVEGWIRQLHSSAETRIKWIKAYPEQGLKIDPETGSPNIDMPESRSPLLSPDGTFHGMVVFEIPEKSPGKKWAIEFKFSPDDAQVSAESDKSNKTLKGDHQRPWEKNNNYKIIKLHDVTTPVLQADKDIDMDLDTVFERFPGPIPPNRLLKAKEPASWSETLDPNEDVVMGIFREPFKTGISREPCNPISGIIRTYGSFTSCGYAGIVDREASLPIRAVAILDCVYGAPRFRCLVETGHESRLGILRRHGSTAFVDSKYENSPTD
ncbi:Heterokaryon incompatibility [Moelleriella libera RCEF 2490]|uniref:Heterokaryon incompatibility n=1 Tax=Moelleriella libera RCEF 2490 TaxID=1081109 RepID=A0A168AFK2_9HYPO|nr:Heterokaryon incompatibility [Moelleriella libera RCEF 2490]